MFRRRKKSSSAQLAQWEAEHRRLMDQWLRESTAEAERMSHWASPLAVFLAALDGRILPIDPQRSLAACRRCKAPVSVLHKNRNKPVTCECCREYVSYEQGLRQRKASFDDLYFRAMARTLSTQSPMYHPAWGKRCKRCYDLLIEGSHYDCCPNCHRYFYHYLGFFTDKYG